jgi:hypothetical protein
MSIEHFVQNWEYLEKFGRFKWLKLPIGGAGFAEFGALMSGVDWAHVWPIVGLAITAVGTACIGLWRYYRLTQLELRSKEREITQAELETQERALALKVAKAKAQQQAQAQAQEEQQP